MPHLILKQCPETKKLTILGDKKDRALAVESLFDIFASNRVPENDENILFTMANYNRSIIGNQLFSSDIYKKAADTGTISVIGFDFDNITLDHSFNLFPLIAEALNLKPETVACVHTGNGIHVYIPFAPALSKQDFDAVQKALYSNAYLILAKKLNLVQSQIDKTGLKSFARYGRIPNNTNVKKKQGQIISKDVILLCPGQSEVDRSIGDIYNKIYRKPINVEAVILNNKIRPKIGQDNTPAPLATENTAETTENISKCCFVEYAKTNSKELKEPEWFALLRVLSKIEPGDLSVTLAVDYSKDYPGHSTEHTLEKLGQAGKYGAISCNQINSVWGQCYTCPHNKKIISPLDLNSNDAWAALIKIKFRKIGQFGPLPNIDIEMFGNFILDKFRDELCFSEDQLYSYKDSCWYVLPEQDFQRSYIGKYCGFIPAAFNATAKSLYDQLCSLTPLRDFKKNHGKIFFKDGILDVITSTVKQHTPETSTNYILNKEVPDLSSITETQTLKFKKFLDDILGSDEEGKGKQRTVQAFFGSVVLGDYPRKSGQMLYLYGDGASGKSTLLCLLELLIPEKFCAGISLSSFNETTAYSVRNCLVAIDDDLQQKEGWRSKNVNNEGLVKKIVTGNNAEMRKLFKMPSWNKTRCKMAVASNDLPTSKDKTRGFSRRLCFITCDRDFSTSGVTELETKIFKECGPEFVRWVLEGVKIYKDNNHTLPKPPNQEKILKEMREKNDPVFAYFNDRIVETEDEESLPTSKIYSDYNLWLHKNGLHFKLDRREFGRRFVATFRREMPDVFKLQSKTRNIRIGKSVCYGYRWVKINSQREM